jgi:hypothetical protein
VGHDAYCASVQVHVPDAPDTVGSLSLSTTAVAVHSSVPPGPIVAPYLFGLALVVPPEPTIGTTSWRSIDAVVEFLVEPVTVTRNWLAGSVATWTWSWLPAKPPGQDVTAVGGVEVGAGVVGVDVVATGRQDYGGRAATDDREDDQRDHHDLADAAPSGRRRWGRGRRNVLRRLVPARPAILAGVEELRPVVLAVLDALLVVAPRHRSAIRVSCEPFWPLPYPSASVDGSLGPLL